MRHYSRLKLTSVILYAVTVVAFLGFFLYMASSERLTVYHAEDTHHYAVLEDVQMELVSDSSAPAGVRKIYRGILDPELSDESCLCFAVSHHSVEVYFDDTLVFSLTTADTNRIGKNVSTNWCSIHVGQEHSGKELTVILTPMFEAALEKDTEFILGSHYSIAFDLLRQELPQMFLCAISMMLGLLLMIVALFFRYIMKSTTNGMIYLGLFSVAVGLWKVTDLRCIGFLLPEYSMAMGYISVGSLFLGGLSLLLYFSFVFVEKQQNLLYIIGSGCCLVSLAVLAVQLLGITELRQNLIFSHIVLLMAVFAVPTTLIYNRITTKEWGVRRSWRLLLLMLLGILLDMFFYYRNGGNSAMSFTILGFGIYAMIVFFITVRTATQNAYTDIRTGLVNRTRWNQLMHRDAHLPEPYAILVIDLNGLKTVNDTLGHEAGDRMIFQLSSMMRNSLPRTSVICRWGGDEFAVLLPAINRPRMEKEIQRLRAAQTQYNEENPELPIHFALGAALSCEHPGITATDLFDLADEDMYRNKQAWYAAKK